MLRLLAAAVQRGWGSLHAVNCRYLSHMQLHLPATLVADPSVSAIAAFVSTQLGGNAVTGPGPRWACSSSCSLLIVHEGTLDCRFVLPF